MTHNNEVFKPKWANDLLYEIGIASSGIERYIMSGRSNFKTNLYSLFNMFEFI